jgi:hypothetical protein
MVSIIKKAGDITAGDIRQLYLSLAKHKKLDRTMKNIKEKIGRFYKQEVATDIVREYTNAGKDPNYKIKDPRLNSEQLVEVTKILFSKENLKAFSKLHPRKDNSIKHQINSLQNAIVSKIIEPKVHQLRENIGNIEDILKEKSKLITENKAEIENILNERAEAIAAGKAAPELGEDNIFLKIGEKDILVESIKRDILEERNSAISKLTSIISNISKKKKELDKELKNIIETGVAVEPHKVQKTSKVSEEKISKAPEVSEKHVTIRGPKR